MKNLLPYAIAWAVLATIVIVLAICRRFVSEHEDDSLHVGDVDSGAATSQQVALAKRLESIDRWGKILTVLALVSGLALAGVFLYTAWMESSRYAG